MKMLRASSLRMSLGSLNTRSTVRARPNKLMQPRSLPPLSIRSISEVSVGGRAPADRWRWAPRI